jgi:prolipoprotein diacylglyceryltransferase
VQGCCHGHPTSGLLAIRYSHPNSRVCRAGLSRQPLHPTPLYSILGNVTIGLLLARLWEVRATPAFIIGAYLILAGLLRFIEEHYRGEPHTPIRAGLRIYQWFAAASIIAGVAISTITTTESLASWTWSASSIATSTLIGLTFGIAMGVDFPNSTRRFARLA